jgi:hypothetical protein
MLPFLYSWLIIRKMFISGVIQEPPSFPTKPSFAELVVTYLPQNEWDKNISFYPGKPPKRSPYTCRYDRYHLKLLKNVESCQVHLSTAWTEWIRLGHYKQGNSQRDMLIATAVSWVQRKTQYEELRKGTVGSIEERLQFEERWIAIGKKE